MTPAPGPGLEKLLQRLVQRLTSLLTNGEFTERGLARLCGISQPHLHHILARKRSLTPHVADAILASLGWGLEHLFSEEELDAILMARRQRFGSGHRIPVVAGRIGPLCPFPDTSAAREWLVVRSPVCEGIRRLFLAELAPDPAVPFSRNASVFALVAEDEEMRLRLSPDAWFVLRWGGAGLVRRVREEGGTLVVLGQETLGASGWIASIPLSGQSLLSIIRGRLLWTGPDPQQHDPFSHSGSGFPIATAS